MNLNKVSRRQIIFLKVITYGRIFEYVVLDLEVCGHEKVLYTPNFDSNMTINYGVIM